MSKLNIHRPGALLGKARRILGVPRGKKAIVFEAAARHLGVGVPPTKAEGYKLLVALCNGTFAPPAKPRLADGDVNSLAFLESYEWRRLRMQVLVKRGARCECCGATPKDGVRMHVDHIKPRRLFPALALEESNLQILCEACNHGKGNWDQTDWRAPEPVAAAPVATAPVDPMRPRLVKRAG